MPRVVISNRLILEAMQKGKVRDALAARAQKTRGRADGLAAQESTNTRAPRVESGTRPKGRPYSRVVMDDGAAQEWGTSRTARRRILGRAAQGE